jgi:hypothetical protein
MPPTGPAGKAGATTDATVALSRGPKARYDHLRVSHDGAAVSRVRVQLRRHARARHVGAWASVGVAEALDDRIGCGTRAAKRSVHARCGAAGCGRIEAAGVRRPRRAPHGGGRAAASAAVGLAAARRRADTRWSRRRNRRRRGSACRDGERSAAWGLGAVGDAGRVGRFRRCTSAPAGGCR